MASSWPELPDGRGLHLIGNDLGLAATAEGPCAEWIDWAEVELLFEVEAFKDRRAAFADFLNARGEEFPSVIRP